MKFLHNMEKKHTEERDKDRKEWKEIREKERQEDRAEMVKVVDMKVAEAIRPFKSKTNSVVQAQKDMKEQVDNLTGLLRGLREKFESHSQSQNSGVSDTSSPVQGELHGHPVGPVWQDRQTVRVQRQPDTLSEIISEARRTVGLFRIDNADLTRMRQEQFGGAKTEEEEKLLAVREFLKMELKLDPKTVEKMDIEKMFFLRKDNPDCMFVTFKYGSSVSKIFDKTYIMRKESRVKPYIPREFRDRARAISEIEYDLRNREKCKTKVKMGFYDLQLFKKDITRGKWELVPLTGVDLPPVDLNAGQSPSKTATTSPAPGRPCQSRPEKRNRESYGSPTLTVQKSAKHDSTAEAVDNTDHPSDFAKALESANLVTDTTAVSPSKDGAVLLKKPDLGMVMSISGTPTKLSQPDASSTFNSPIFTRHGKN